MSDLISAHEEIDDKRDKEGHPLEIKEVDGDTPQFVIVNRALSPESWEAIKGVLKEVLHHR